ncbi:hypothetical protein niasHS_003811 [Heterodera schachtii]|uniref:Ground-like domain-containing protein n=1 Tax=Heterodera schachtii TaxID=97005 RepID=A0ABD2K3H7_HETSC
MNDVMLLGLLWSMPVNLSLFAAILTVANEISNDLAFAAYSANTSPLPSQLTLKLPVPSPSLLPFVPWSKILAKKVRISPIMKSKMEVTTTTMKGAKAKQTLAEAGEHSLMMCNLTFRPRQKATESDEGMFGTPRNNYLQLLPKELVRKRRNSSSWSRRQKRTGFPPPAVPFPSAFSAPAFPASAPAPEEMYPNEPVAQEEFFNGPTQIEQQQQQTFAEQGIQQGAEAPAFQPSPPASFGQPLPPPAAPQPAAPFAAPSPPAAPQPAAPFAAPSPPAAPQPAAPFAAPSPPAPVFQPPLGPNVPVEPVEPIEEIVPIEPVEEIMPVEPGGEVEPVGFVPVEPPSVQPPVAVQPSPYQEKLTSPTSTVPFTTLPSSTTAAERCELLRYPLPECYTDDSNLMCCNSELENTMKMAFNELTNSEDNFHRCNVQQIANKVQLMSEDRFNTTFEVITGIGDYASRSHFFHNYICKIEKDDRFILAYASARPEFDSVPIDGDTSGKTHGHSAANAAGAYRNSESVQHGKARQTEKRTDLLNFVYTFRRIQRAQKGRVGDQQKKKRNERLIKQRKNIL